MNIVIKRADGSVSIMRVIFGSVEDAVNQWKEIHGAEYASHHEVDSIPGSREYRDAWVLDGNQIVIDELRAAEIDAMRAEK